MKCKSVVTAEKTCFDAPYRDMVKCILHSVERSCHSIIRYVMHQRGMLFVLMAAVLPTVMNSLDDAPRAASIALSHTDGGWKLVLEGNKGGAHMPRPSVDTYGRADQPTCTY